MYELDSWPKNLLENFVLKLLKLIGFILALEQYMMEKVCGVLVMILPERL